MPTPREHMARLRAARIAAGRCPACEQPAAPYTYCADCRSDRAAWIRSVRYVTRWTRVTLQAHSST